jgi:O-antigen biosynthesis protein
MTGPSGAVPRASILIVTHRRVDRLVGCLASVRKHVSTEVPYETLVLFNGTPVSARERVTPALRADTVFANGVNHGFAAGNNRLAALARGDFLVFLNDDTEVQPGWLEALVETADVRATVEAVGSRILHPDGKLQEAGSIVWRDGSTIGVGRGLPAGSRRYDYLREADYVSACSLLVRRSTFERIGGFDERYFPGYVEDVDLCLTIRALGGRVLYQPRSVVVHHESQSAAEAKTFLILRGRRMLREKWGSELNRRAEAKPWDPQAIELAMHRARGNPPRVLIVDDRIPDQGGGGGWGRALDAIRELSAAGYAISLYPSIDASGDRTTLQDLGVEVVEGDLVAHLAAAHVAYDVAIISRPNNFNVVSRLRWLQPLCAVVYDAEALFYRRLEREAVVLRDTHPEKAVLAELEARGYRKLEPRIGLKVDRIVAASAVEACALKQRSPNCPVDVIEGRSLNARFTERPFERRWGMVLVAGWLAPYPSPNSDGLEWFLEHVLPFIKNRLPWAQLRVTGRNPHEQLAYRRSPWLSFVGHVEELGEFYDGARVAVVPMRFGAGIKNKALEAVLHGVPVVATSVGAEGVPGSGGLGVSAADDPAEFAERVVTLLDDRHAWEAARSALRKLNEEERSSPKQSWPAIVESALMGKTFGSVAI